MKSIQRMFTLALPRGMREAGRRSILRQNAFGRRFGLRWLTTVMTFCFVTVALTWTYQAALLFVESGLIRTPARMSSTFVSESE